MPTRRMNAYSVRDGINVGRYAIKLKRPGNEKKP